MRIDYHESHPGHPGYGWDAESLEEAIQYITQDKKELIDTIKAHAKELDKKGIQVINYSVKITISK